MPGRSARSCSKRKDKLMIPPDLLKMFRSDQRLILDDLEELVGFESPSGDKIALEALKGVLIDRLQMIAASVKTEPGPLEYGHVLARFKGPAVRCPALVLGHYDTVWPSGTLDTMPFRVEGGRAFGPGTFDMKASLAIFLRVMELIERVGLELPRPVWALFTCDEEIGSPTSRSLIEELARESAYVLVLEPALANGGLKTSRKGVGRFHLEVSGRAAHAGVAPRNGRSAVVELAHQVLALQTLQDLAAGTTINVGVVQGGTTTNVVPAHASAEIDVRVASRSEEARIESALRTLVPVTPENRLTLHGSFNRPPMERTPANASLFEKARKLARTGGLGFELTEGSTGGGSDGNFTSALGIPTLDGLGARGAGAHADDEHILVASLLERATLMHLLLTGLQVES
jgi:glutamate carboxypeptidase